MKKKKTIYPEWNTSFDFHLYEDRVIHMEIIQRPDVKVAECSMLAQSLADLAKDGEPTSVWVIADYYYYSFLYTLCVLLTYFNYDFISITTPNKIKSN